MIHNKTLNKKTMEKIKNYTQFKIKALEILEQEHEEKIKEIYGSEQTAYNLGFCRDGENFVQNEIIGKVEMKFAFIIYINFDLSIKESLEISKEDINFSMPFSLNKIFDEIINKNNKS